MTIFSIKAAAHTVSNTEMKPPEFHQIHSMPEKSEYSVEMPISQIRIVKMPYHK